MKLLPINIKEQKFKSNILGFAKEEVTTFLNIVADGVEGLISENRDLNEELEKKESEIKGLKENKEQFKRLVASVEGFKSTIIGVAEKEAQTIVGEAKLKAKEILRGTCIEGEKIKKEIDKLNEEKRRFAVDFRSKIESFLNMLEADIGEGNESSGARRWMDGEKVAVEFDNIFNEDKENKEE